MSEPAPAAPRVVLITGASRGLGAAIARAFAGPGSHLVLVARTTGGLEEVDDAVRLAGGSATLVPLDLTRPDGIERLGPALAERHGKLDVLVANAGVLGALTPAAHLEPKLLGELLALHVVANQRLIRALEPLLKAAPAGRAIFTSAPEARAHKPFWAGYAASKAALEALVLCWAAEVRKSRLRVNLVEPPPLPTRLRARGFPGEDPDRLTRPEEAAQIFVSLADPGCQRHGEVVRIERRNN